jgi:Bacterial TniB protein
MTLDLSHLASSVEEEAFHDAPTRIRLVQTAHGVEFSRRRLALEELERRYQYPSCARMPCMLLYGDSGMAKTMLIEKMERQHPNSHHERRGLTLRPVLRVQMPSSPDERLRALNLLKFAANELKIAVVAVGTHDAFHAMQIDAQVASRFEPLLLPRSTEIDGFRGFVTSIEIANGLKLIGRHRRMTPDDYAGDRATRSLVDIEDPAVRGSALWFAHSVMASFHQDASDRQTAYRRTSRQAIKYAASPSAAAVWLASRMSTWPERYRRKCWLNLQS